MAWASPGGVVELSVSRSIQASSDAWIAAVSVFVAAATVAAMLGEVRSYFEDFGSQWLLAVMGSLILVLDVWVIGEGFWVLIGEPRPVQSAN